MAKRILFAWERGSAYGHLARDLPIAAQLRSRGHEVLFAVRNVNVAAELLIDRQFRFVAAPAEASPPFSGRRPGTYTEMLYRHGYSDPNTLRGLIEAWLGLLDLARPDLVVANYAPTAMLAADIRGIPQFLAGTGWEIPPIATPCPWIDLLPPPDDDERDRREAEVIARINAALASHGASPIGSVADLFRGKPTAITTFPELDHFGRHFEQGGIARPAEQYVGHVGNSGLFADRPWGGSARKRIFAYLRPSDRAPAILGGLRQLAQEFADIACVMPGFDGEHRRLAGPKVHLSGEGIEIGPALAETDLFVGYAGAGSVAMALLSGVPLALCPDTLERSVTTERVLAMGAGASLERGDDRDVAVALRQAASDPGMREAARAFARLHRNHDPEAAADQVARRVADVV